MIKLGMTVKLKESVQKTHTCPEEREDNLTAVVVGKMFESQDALWMNRDLHGCRGWNEDDVVEVSE